MLQSVLPHACCGQGAGAGTANLVGGAAGQLAGAAMGSAQTYRPTGLPGLQDVGGMLPMQQSGQGQQGQQGGIVGKVGKVLGAFG